MLFNITQKQCDKCRQFKPLSEFHKNMACKDGLAHYCKNCKKEYAQKWNAAHSEQGKVRSKKWKQDNPERVQEYAKQYDTTHREKRRNQLREWRNENLEKAREFCRKWQDKNKDRLSESRKKKYPQIRESVIERVRKWAANNRAKRNAYNRNRYAQQFSSGVITEEEWQKLKIFYEYTCLCCHRQEPEIRLEIDHVKPLVLGGENLISNAQPLCRSCNASKGGRHIDYRNR